MSNQPQAHVADERAAFEAWAGTCDGNCSPENLKMFRGEYISPLVERDWIVWQAARAPSPAGANGTDANDICQLPPADWYCTRKAGHDGPCAAIQHEPDRELDADDHAAIAHGMARLAAGAPAETPKPVEPFHYYGLSAEELQQLLEGSLKPEEIASTDEVEQHSRVGELVRWFARFTQGKANPKWANRHACELAYFISTNGINHSIDLDTIRQAAFKEGVNITPEERGTLERIGFAQPAPAPATDTRDGERYRKLKTLSKPQLLIWRGAFGCSVEAIDELLDMMPVDAAMLSANSPREAG